MEGQLVSSLSSATPPENGPRLHQKLDNTGFTYVGRSYGVGASVGLLDNAVTTNTLALFYSYIEDGYEATTACAYNESSGFILRDTTNVWVYEAYGELPDSDAGPEELSYIDHTMDSIVVLDVAHFATSPAAGPGSENESQQVVNLRRFIAVLLLAAITTSWTNCNAQSTSHRRGSTSPSTLAVATSPSHHCQGMPPTLNQLAI